jgi:hypothetical protein
MSELLRHALRDLAEEVSVVDLRDRSVATSRRQTRRHRALAGASALAAVVAAVGITVQLLPGGGIVQFLPGDEVVRPGDRPLLPGTTIYVTTGEDDDLGLAYRYGDDVTDEVGGRRETAWLFPVYGVGECPWTSAVVSPDGAAIAYVTGSAATGDVGDLYVADRNAGFLPTLVATDVSCSGGRHPIWYPDSLSLRIARADDATCGRVVVAAGEFTALGEDWCGYVAFAPDGAYRARAGNVETADGVAVRPIPAVPDAPAQTVPLSISVDGRLVGLGHLNSDPSITRVTAYVADTESGRILTLAEIVGSGHDQEQLQGVHFLADGGMVVATYSPAGNTTWYLLDAHGAVTATLSDAPDWPGAGRFEYKPWAAVYRDPGW